MIPTYLLLIPAVFTIIWMLFVKYRQHKFTDFIILLLASMAALLNVVLVYRLITSEPTTQLRLLQMTVASAIVPLAYTYFARQVGKRVINSTATILLWLLVLLTFVPQILIYNPFESFAIPENMNLMPFSLYIFSHGEKQFAIHTGDLAAILQCIVTILRIVPFMLLLRRHNLHLSNRVYSFGACWILIIAFIMMVSGMTYDELCSPFGSAFYFSFYSLLLIFTNTLIAKGYDLYPIETEQHEVVENIIDYVHQQYGTMSEKLRALIEGKELYKDTQLSAESVIEQLHTNHTYFSKMMSSVWGMSFSEYVNNLRLAHAKQLLPDESLTISAIASQSGFADAGYMSRKFKAKYGITPSEWRKQH